MKQPRDANSGGERQQGLRLVDILQRALTVLSDQELTPGERVATAVVVLRAGCQSGLAWPGYRSIRRDTGLSNDVIANALATPESGTDQPPGKAIGRHLEPAGCGPRGVQRYRVLPPNSAAPNAPASGALRDGQRSDSQPPALGSGTASAPVSTPQRSGQRCITGVELKEGTGGNCSPAPASVAASGNSNGTADPLTAQALMAWQRSPRPPGQTVRDCENAIRQHVSKDKYTVKALADYLATAETPGPFWEFDKAIPLFFQNRGREAREALATRFAGVKVGWTAVRKDGTARGTVHLKVTHKITVKVTEPGTEYPDITTSEEFDRWSISPPGNVGEAPQRLPMPHQTHQDGSGAM